MQELIYYIATLLVLPSVLMSHAWDDLKDRPSFFRIRGERRYLLKGLLKVLAAAAIAVGYDRMLTWYSGFYQNYVWMAVPLTYVALFLIDIRYEIFGTVSSIAESWEDWAEEHWKGLGWTALIGGTVYLLTPNLWILLGFVNRAIGAVVDFMVNTIDGLGLWYFGLMEVHGFMMVMAATVPWIIVACLLWLRVRLTYDRDNWRRQASANAGLANILAGGYEALRVEIDRSETRSRVAQRIRELVIRMQGFTGKFDANGLEFWRPIITQFVAQRENTRAS